MIWSVFYASASNLGFPFPELLFSSIAAVRFERIEGGCLRELDSKLGFVFLDRLVWIDSVRRSCWLFLFGAFSLSWIVFDQIDPLYIMVSLRRRFCLSHVMDPKNCFFLLFSPRVCYVRFSLGLLWIIYGGNCVIGVAVVLLLLCYRDSYVLSTLLVTLVKCWKLCKKFQHM